ncbi:MAG TPA: hypothetical protein VGV67_12905 [Solirubrobacteraceae bacterium]|nr:hypothetical protein [Solirubrobacteraceae bacterium]
MGSRFATTAWIARSQKGRVAWRQLVARGVDRHTIQRWLDDGRLRAVHVGVYAVGHLAPSVEAEYMAAVLASGEGAVLSHRAAAYMLGLLRGVSPPPAETTVPTTAHRRRPGIVIHRVRALHELDVAFLDDIPITTVPRVLLDLARTTTQTNLTRLCHEAWVRHDCAADRVEGCIARNPHKPGAARLRRALGSDVTLSFLEDAFLELLAAHALPLPRTNIDRAGDKVDCHWPPLDLTIELLGYRFHATRRAFEEDVARRRRSGHIAYTYGDVTERGASTAAELRGLLRG